MDDAARAVIGGREVTARQRKDTCNEDDLFDPATIGWEGSVNYWPSSETGRCVSGILRVAL